MDTNCEMHTDSHVGKSKKEGGKIVLPVANNLPISNKFQKNYWRNAKFGFLKKILVLLDNYNTEMNTSIKIKPKKNI